jgi:hypothetical protein
MRTDKCYGRPCCSIRPLDPLVPTNVPTDLTWRDEKASELEPRYGIEP